MRWTWAIWIKVLSIIKMSVILMNCVYSMHIAYAYCFIVLHLKCLLCKSIFVMVILNLVSYMVEESCKVILFVWCISFYGSFDTVRVCVFFVSPFSLMFSDWFKSCCLSLTNKKFDQHALYWMKTNMQISH